MAKTIKPIVPGLSPLYVDNAIYNYLRTNYPDFVFANTTPYICIDDLLNYQYVVCAIPNSEVEFMMMEFGRREVVAEYDSLEAMVRDGWRLGT